MTCRAQRAAWLSPLELSAEVEAQPIPASRASNKGCLDLSLGGYLELVDWTGRQWRADKRGTIDTALPAILERLRLSGDGWIDLLHAFHKRFRRAAGRPETLAREARSRGRRWLHGTAASRTVFEPAAPAAGV